MVSKGKMLPELSREEIQRYSRHLLIPEVGLAGQRKLKAASVLVIGAGGLGSPAALYLAAAGVGRIGLVDGDVVEASNLQRQIIHAEAEIGEPKVASARRRLLAINPGVEVIAYEQPFTSANALEIAKDYDLLLDCSDNFPTRYLVNDAAVLLGKPDVYGSVFRFDGQVSVFDAKSGPCYRCIFPEPPPPWLAPSCADGGVLGVLPGTIGTLQATEALKLILGIGTSLSGRLLLYDALEMSFETVSVGKNPRCKLCGQEPDARALIDYKRFCGLDAEAPGSAGAGWEISASELAARLRVAGPAPLLVDVREPHELEISRIAGARLIPLGELARRLTELDGAGEIVLFCRSGRRSRRALEILAGAGIENARHLQGGINAWAAQVDPSLPVY